MSCTVSNYNKFLCVFLLVYFQVAIKPSKGVLSPLESCNVDLVFRALYCQSFESVLQLTVLNGTGW